jgi:hypothetical protein
MRKFMVGFLALMLVVMGSVSDGHAAKAKASPTAVVVVDQVDGVEGPVTLQVGTDYSWVGFEKTVKADKIKYGSPEWKAGRAICMASDQAYVNYKAAKEQGNYAEAAKWATDWSIRGWSLWNAGCAKVGKKNDLGAWEYDVDLELALWNDALDLWIQAEECADQSTKSDVGTLKERIAASRDVYDKLVEH